MTHADPGPKPGSLNLFARSRILPVPAPAGRQDAPPQPASLTYDIEHLVLPFGLSARDEREVLQVVEALLAGLENSEALRAYSKQNVAMARALAAQIRKGNLLA